MYTYIYGTIFALAVLAVIFIALRNYKNIDIYQWSLVVLVQFVCLAYFARSMAASPKEALLLNDLVYLDGTLIPALFMFSLMRSFRVRVSEWFRIGYFLLSIAHLLFVWVGSQNGLYYKGFYIEITSQGTLFWPVSGPYKFLHYVYLVPIAIICLWVTISALRTKQNKVSKFLMYGYLMVIIATALAYGTTVILETEFECIPFVYLMGIWLMVLSYDNQARHDINGIVMNMHEEGAFHAYVAFDLRRRFLGANHEAIAFMPQLAELKIDSVVSAENKEICDTFYGPIEQFELGNNAPHYYTVGDTVYKYEVSYFFTKKHGSTGGYLFEFIDDTERQTHLQFVEHYNVNLRESLREQSKHIGEIQNRVVLGLADMVENRDSSTGGHVKRTSDIISILVNTMMDHNMLNIEPRLAEDIIRSAPMHDLGKISIDNSILCKPGRLTEEEFALMKTHAAKSGDIVRAILEGVEEPHFVETAYRLARHHHERWDGKGYPDGLKGYEIPIEARVMAVADVYDALVSKRCYKEPMSYEQAAQVMLENMGTQFDPMMKPVFEMSREKLEQYYSSISD